MRPSPAAGSVRPEMIVGFERAAVKFANRERNHDEYDRKRTNSQIF